MRNEQAINNLLDMLAETCGGGMSSISVGDWSTVADCIEQNGFKFKIHIKEDSTTFVAYKKGQDSYLHQYNTKAFPMSKSDFYDYLTTLCYISKIEIVQKAENGKKLR